MHPNNIAKVSKTTRSVLALISSPADAAGWILPVSGWFRSSSQSSKECASEQTNVDAETSARQSAAMGEEPQEQQDEQIDERKSPRWLRRRQRRCWLVENEWSVEKQGYRNNKFPN